MKKSIIAFILSFFVLSSICAYNPPVNGEFFTELSSPRLLGNSSSSCGGPVFYCSPDSISVNPALPTSEQLVKINLAYTALASFSSSESHHFGSAMQTGVIVPTKYFVFTGYLNGVLSPFDAMNLGNSMNLKLGLAKEITNNINFGIGLNSGVLWAENVDWNLSANLGILCHFDKLGFIKDFRYGLAINNLGKNFTNSGLLHPIDSINPVSMFPTICTVKTGVAGLLLSNDAVKLGFSFDVSTPLIQNFVFDGGLELGIKDTIFVTISDRFNLAEYTNNHIDIIPSIGINFKFSFRLDNNQLLKDKGWEDILADGSVTYKQLYKDVNALSMGVDLSLGKKDVTPPVIQIFIDEDED